MPELLGRRENDLPPVGAKTNEFELIENHIHTRGFVPNCTVNYQH